LNCPLGSFSQISIWFPFSWHFTLTVYLSLLDGLLHRCTAHEASLSRFLLCFYPLALMVCFIVVLLASDVVYFTFKNNLTVCLAAVLSVITSFIEVLGQDLTIKNDP
jgi:hypothetical protein